MGRTRLRGTRKDPLTILRVLIWSLMRETQRVRQRVGPWPTVPPTPVCAWPSRPRSARSALGCGAGGAAAEGQEGLSSSVSGDTRRVEGLGPNVTAGPRSPRTAARVRLRDPRPCTLGTEGLCVTVRAPAAVNPRLPCLTWLLRPIWKPERAHRNHDAEQMRDPRKHGGPATHGPATEGCGMFQNRPTHTDSSSIRIQKTLQTGRPEVFMGGPLTPFIYVGLGHQAGEDRGGPVSSRPEPRGWASGGSRRRRGRCGTPQGQVRAEPTRPAGGDPVPGHSCSPQGPQSQCARQDGAATSELEFSRLAQGVP